MLGDVVGEALVDRGPRRLESEHEILDTYRRGDQLRVIAKVLDSSVDRISRTVARLGSFGDELERSRAVRRRSLTAHEALAANREMVYRLESVGISLPEIPVVLKALGIDIEVDLAVDLLHMQGIPAEAPEVLSSRHRAADRLSLLYIAGKHHGIEPDYQLALGQIPIEEVAELRLHLQASFPPRRVAEILAVAETTKLAIRARKMTALSVSDYDSTAKSIRLRFGSITREPNHEWPVPGLQLRQRLGGGFWESAIASIGLKLETMDAPFTKDDYVAAINDFAETCKATGHACDVETYDRWVTAETARRKERPSAIGLAAHFGSWKAALKRAHNGSGRAKHSDATDGHDVDPLFEWVDEAEEAAWVRAGEFICELLANIPRNRSVQVQYGGPSDGSIRPYAQGTRGADGVWCEIVSERFLPGEQWPIDTEYLEAEDWLTPDDEVPQWCKEKVEIHDAGHVILAGLRHGRLCPDPWQLRWSTRQFLEGPGPDHGVTLEAALAGEIQTLRNAS